MFSEKHRKRARLVFDELRDSVRVSGEFLSQTWQPAFDSNQSEFVELFLQSVRNDPEVSDERKSALFSVLERISLAYMFQAISQFIDVVCATETDTEMADHSFDRCLRLGSAIEAAHRKHEIKFQDFNLSVNHLFQTVSVRLGPALSAVSKKQLVIMLELLQLCVLVSYSECLLSKAKEPTLEQWKAVRESWPRVFSNVDLVLDQLLKHLPCSITAAHLFLQDLELLLRLAPQHRADYSLLKHFIEDLSLRHSPNSFWICEGALLSHAWLSMLKHVLKVGLHGLSDAWKTVLDYLSTLVRLSLLSSEVLLVLRPPQRVKLLVQLHSISQIMLDQGHFTVGFDYYAATLGTAKGTQGKFLLSETQSTEGSRQRSEDCQWTLSLVNSLGVSTDESQKLYQRRIIEGSDVFEFGHHSGDFINEFNIEDYPCDSHTLIVDLSLSTKREIALFDAEQLVIESTAQNGLCSGSQWRVLKPALSLHYGSDSERNRQICRMTIPIQRRSEHMLWLAVVPIAILDLIALWIPFLQTLSDTLTVSGLVCLTSLLTQFHIISSLDCPNGPTQLEKYLSIDLTAHASCAISSVVCTVVLSPSVRSVVALLCSVSVCIVYIWNTRWFMRLISAHNHQSKTGFESNPMSSDGSANEPHLKYLSETSEPSAMTKTSFDAESLTERITPEI